MSKSKSQAKRTTYYCKVVSATGSQTMVGCSSYVTAQSAERAAIKMLVNSRSKKYHAEFTDNSLYVITRSAGLHLAQVIGVVAVYEAK